jgi:hypothetical protein
VTARRHALRRLGPGDYLLVSNDGRGLYRIRRYVDGPSGGLDWPRDRKFWGADKWKDSSIPTSLSRDDLDDPARWRSELYEMDETREQVIEKVLANGRNG